MRRRIALALAALTVWVAGSAAGTPPAPRAAALPLMKLERAHRAEFLPALDGKEPIFILVLGSDARPGQNILKERADSIHIIGVNPAQHAASILGFPRDSYVPVPGHGTQKINSALTIGGPPLAVKTIEAETGIRVDFYLITSFRGLRNMVDAVGGIQVNVLVPMHDRFSHANFDPGVHHFNGAKALAFARDRHSFSSGDLERSQNQGRLFLSALGEFRRDFEKNPSVVLNWMGAGLRNVATDLSLNDLLKLAFTAAQVQPDRVKNVVIPGHGALVGDRAVVIVEPGAKNLYRNMRDDGLID